MKILFVTLSNIGDAVLSLPVLEGLGRRFPGGRVDVVAGPRSKAVFENHPFVNRVFVDEKRRPFGERLVFFRELRRERYDLVVDLRRSLFSFLGKRSVGLFVRSAGRRHKRQSHLDLLRRLGVRDLSGPPAVQAGAAVPAEGGSGAPAGVPAGPGPLVVVAPGSKSETKQWPKERFGLLAGRLSLSDGARVVWIGDETERGLAEEICGGMRGASVNLAGRLSWKESMALIGQADLVVTNDSAPLHAADHQGRKVLCFFGPTDPVKYGPEKTPAGVLFRGKFCSPCEKAQCRYGHECLTEITVDEAYKRARFLLAGEPVSRSTGEPVNGLTGSPLSPNILVIRLDRIGDMLLSFDALACLRAKFPAARITVLARPYAKDAAERSSDVSDVLVYDYRKKGEHGSLRGYFRLLREIRKRRYDAAFVLNPTFRSNLLCFLAGIPRRIGYASRGRWLLTDAVPDRRREGRQHESVNVTDVLRPYGVPAGARSAGFGVYPEDEAAAEDLLSAAGVGPGEDIFVLHPDSSSPSKRWPAEKFAELAKRLSGERGWRPVLVGAVRHADADAGTACRMGGNACDLSGRTAIPVLAAVLKRARVLVSNDSGPVHLAALVGTPVVSIFGRNQAGLSPARWRPLGQKSAHVQKDAGCVVCLADECPIGFECLKALEVDEVLAAVNALLSSEQCLSQAAG